MKNSRAWHDHNDELIVYEVCVFTFVVCFSQKTLDAASIIYRRSLTCYSYMDKEIDNSLQ
jgi:hypothetical protein